MHARSSSPCTQGHPMPMHARRGAQRETRVGNKGGSPKLLGIYLETCECGSPEKSGSQSKNPVIDGASFWWREPGMIRRHHDFQSCALPAELPRLAPLLVLPKCAQRWSAFRVLLADRTGFEPATTRVTGGYANRCTTDPKGCATPVIRADASIRAASRVCQPL